MTRTRTVWSAAAGVAVLAAAVLSAGTAQAAPSAATAQTLAATESTLATTLTTVGGTAWGVDPKTKQVLVSVDSSVTGAKLAAVKAAVAKAGSAARLESVPGRFTRYLSGGQAIYAGGGGRCSLGFNVRSGTTYYFITAGHCTEISANWYSNSAQTALLGTRSGTSFPSNDYGIVRYAAGQPTPPGNVWLYSGSSTQDIVSAANPTVGQSVRRSGSTTGLRSGTVQALNATVNYGGGDIVYGLIRTNVCAEPGDSGGPLFAGTVALGLTSGGSGNCRSGGTTFFQPVVEVLNRYGVSVY